MNSKHTLRSVAVWNSDTPLGTWFICAVTWATPSWTWPDLWYFTYQIESHLIYIFLLMALDLSSLGAVLPHFLSPPRPPPPLPNFGYQADGTLPTSKQQLGAELTQGQCSACSASYLKGACCFFHSLFCLLESGVPRESEGR